MIHFPQTSPPALNPMALTKVIGDLCILQSSKWVEFSPYLLDQQNLTQLIMSFILVTLPWLLPYTHAHTHLESRLSGRPWYLFSHTSHHVSLLSQLCSSSSKLQRPPIPLWVSGLAWSFLACAYSQGPPLYLFSGFQWHLYAGAGFLGDLISKYQICTFNISTYVHIWHIYLIYVTFDIYISPLKCLPT